MKIAELKAKIDRHEKLVRFLSEISFLLKNEPGSCCLMISGGYHDDEVSVPNVLLPEFFSLMKSFIVAGRAEADALRAEIEGTGE